VIPKSLKFYADVPTDAMWTYLRTLETRDGLRRALQSEVSEENAEAVRASIRQAREYFAAARATPLLTRPVLAYYGMVSLGKLLFLLDRNDPISIDALENLERRGHGLKHFDETSQSSVFVLEDGEIEVTADGSSNPSPRGVFPHLARLLVGNSADAWLSQRISILQLMRSVPQLETTLDQVCNGTRNYLGLGVETLRHTDDSLEVTVSLSESGLSTPDDVNALVPYLDTAGLKFEPGVKDRHGNASASFKLPHFEDSYALLVREESYRHASTLPASFKMVRLDSLLASYMLMYALSIVARYKPHKWTATLGGHTSSLLPVIETFMQTCDRWWPNLLLNRLTGNWLRFAHPSYW